MEENRRPFEPMTLENVGDGRAVELFELALSDIRLDLGDADKDPEGRRRITILVDFVPSSKQGAPLEIVVGSDVKLAKRIPERTLATLSPTGAILQYRNTQTELPLAPVHPLQNLEEVNGDQ